MRLNCWEKFKDKEVLSISPMINYVESRSIEKQQRCIYESWERHVGKIVNDENAPKLHKSVR